MSCWREMLTGLLAGFAAAWLCAPTSAQMLRILPGGQLTRADVEVEAVPNEPETLSAPPFVEPQPDWAETDLAPIEDSEVPLESYAGPGGQSHRPLRRQWHRTRHDAAELYERLRAPERARSWTNRPVSFGGFIGGMFSTELIGGRVEQEPSFFTGGRLGWDASETWGLETRLGLAEMNLRGENDAVFLDKNELTIWDADLMYYPWGESRLRPFLTLGLGFLQHDFVDDTGVRVKDTLFAIPFGLGFKYRVDQRLALRFDVQDNFAFAGGHDIDSTNNIAVTAGVEIRFGGRKKNYWPWDPSRTWW